MYTAIFDTVTDAQNFINDLQRIHGTERLTTKPIEWNGEKAILHYNILPTPHDEYKAFLNTMHEIDEFFNPYE